MNKSLTKSFGLFFAGLSLILAMIGYRELGVAGIDDQFYKAIQLFGLESDFSGPISWKLNIARFLSPLSLLGIFLQYFTHSVHIVSFCLKNFFTKDLFIFFGDGKFTDILREELKGKFKVVHFGMMEFEEHNIYDYSFIYSRHKRSRLLEWTVVRSQKIYIENLRSPELYYILELLKHLKTNKPIKVWVHTTTSEQAEYINRFSNLYGENIEVESFNMLHQSSFIFTKNYQPMSLCVLPIDEYIKTATKIHLVGLNEFMKRFFEKLFIINLMPSDKVIHYEVHYGSEDIEQLEALKSLPEFKLLEHVEFVPYVEKNLLLNLIDQPINEESYIYLGNSSPFGTIHLAEKIKDISANLRSNRYLIMTFHDLNEEDDLFISKSSKEILSGDYSKYLHIHPYLIFGEDNFIEDFNAFHDDLDEKAKFIHESYLKENNLPASEGWKKLSSELKDSNRLATLSSDNYKKISTLYNIDELAEVEHVRWVTEKRLAGLEYGAIKNVHLKQHPCLVSYKDLNIEDKEKDVNNVKRFIKR